MEYSLYISCEVHVLYLAHHVYWETIKRTLRIWSFSPLKIILCSIYWHRNSPVNIQSYSYSFNFWFMIDPTGPGGDLTVLGTQHKVSQLPAKAEKRMGKGERRITVEKRAGLGAGTWGRGAGLEAACRGTGRPAPEKRRTARLPGSHRPPFPSAPKSLSARQYRCSWWPNEATRKGSVMCKQSI